MVRFQKSILSNGLRVVSESHPLSRAVSIGIWVNTGTRDELPVQMGISHMLEHMVFKGTKTRSAYQIAKSLESLGGELNAYTTKEYTVYHCLVLKEHWSQGLEVLSDLVSNMKMNQKEFKLEKGVILQEIAMGDDNLEEVIFDELLEIVYDNHPMSFPILGTIKSVGNMTQRMVQEYYKKTYCGTNMFVSAAGNLEHGELVQAVEKMLGAKKKSRAMPRRKKPRFKVARRLIDKESEQAHMVIAFEAPSFKDKFRFEAFIVNALLGGGMTSWLYQSIREKRGLAYSVYSMLMTNVDSGLIAIYAAFDMENAQHVFDLVIRDLEKLRNRRVTAADVELFKTQVKGALLLGSDDVDNRMTSLGVNEMVFEKYKPVDEVLAEVEEVSAESVNAFIEQSLDMSSLSGVLMGAGASKQHWFKSIKNLDSSRSVKKVKKK